MPVTKCGGVVSQAHGLSHADAEEVVKSVYDRANTMARELGLDQATAIQRAAASIQQDAEDGVAASQRARIANLRARNVRRADLQTLAVQNKSMAHGLRNINVSTNRGQLAALEGTVKAGGSRALGALHNDIEKAGLTQAWHAPENQEALARELAELNTTGGKPGVSQNGAAKQMAKIVHDHLEYQRGEKNALGGQIGKSEGYFGRRSYDARKILAAGLPEKISDRIRLGQKMRDDLSLAAFRKDVLDRFGDGYFEGKPDKEAAIRRLWGEFVSGNHINPAEHDPVAHTFTGGQDLLARDSKGRTITFKSPADEFAFMDKYGVGDQLSQRLEQQVMTSGQDLETIRRMGSNPTAEMLADIKWAKDGLVDTDPHEVTKIDGMAPQIMGHLNLIMGNTGRPANDLIANAAAQTRALAIVSKLGGVAFTHFASALPAKIMHHGLLDGIASTFRPLGRFAASPEFKEFGSMVSAGIDSFHGGTMRGIPFEENTTGWTRRMTNMYTKATGVEYILKGEKIDSAAVAARELGFHADKALGELRPAIQRTLSRYGFTSGDWDIMRTAADHFKFSDGGEAIIPRAANRADAGAIEAHLRSLGAATPSDLPSLASYSRGIPEGASDDLVASRIAEYRKGLESRIDTYLTDTAERDVVTSGVQETWDLTRGTQAGTYAGEVLRFIAQFKKWPIAACRQLLGEQLYNEKNPAGKALGVLTLLTVSAFAGYGRMAINAMLKNEQPQEMSPSVFLAAMAQGGGSGILGDLLLAKENRFGGGLTDTLAGPVLGEGASNLFKIYSTAKGWASDDPDMQKQQMKDLPAEVVRMIRSNTPTANMFYLRQAWNMLIFNHLMETASPGYMARAQARAAANGRKALFPSMSIQP